MNHKTTWGPNSCSSKKAIALIGFLALFTHRATQPLPAWANVKKDARAAGCER